MFTADRRREPVVGMNDRSVREIAKWVRLSLCRNFNNSRVSGSRRAKKAGRWIVDTGTDHISGMKRETEKTSESLSTLRV